MPFWNYELVMTEPDELRTPSSTLPRRRCRIPRLSRSTSDAAPRPKSSGGGDLPPWEQGRRLPSLDGDLGSAAGSVPFSLDDDGSSVKSFGSFMSYASQATTEASAASRPVSRCHYGKRYILHCERHLARPEEYLTPTQRREREIRQLKSALARQVRRCEEKELEVERLKAEVRTLQDAITQIQDGKHNLMNSSQESDPLDSIIAKNSASEISFESHDGGDQTSPSNDDSGIVSISPRDSSEFGELQTMTAEKAVCTSPIPDDSERASSDRRPSTECGSQGDTGSPGLSPELDRFFGAYKLELENLKAQHHEHYQDLKERFTERVDDLLQKLTDANTRYLELRPLFERAQDKIEHIETQLSEVQRDMESQEEYHSQMYLKMYRKGQASARQEEDEALDFSGRAPRRATVPDLLRQLQALEHELDATRQLVREAGGDRQAEYTLRFLKDAVFYFLTKKDKEHLKAIQSILGFTDAERMAVAKAIKHRRLFCSPFKLKK
ncbi:protein quick-to-court-like [Uloborus diversus]|uniref:protein quick-to-court-like n=1 Tax=Uloborus diversus TaxID=327109 RepID=UPI00240A5CFF|nr:protein quick-to-court-like [Uloborus diversus]